VAKTLLVAAMPPYVIRGKTSSLFFFFFMIFVPFCGYNSSLRSLRLCEIILLVAARPP